MFVTTYIYMVTWTRSSEVASKRLREAYLGAILRQDIAFFDNVGAGEVATRIQTDTHLVHQGISEKVPVALSFLSAFITGFALAYSRSWKLSLATPAQGSVEVRHVHLVTPFGDELLANGDFDHGLDHWFFSTDVDPPWHLHSLPVAILFDQGWLGVLAWAAVVAGAIVVGGRLAWRAQAEVPAALPALLGFLASGLLNTLIDAPRFLWLVLVLAWMATQKPSTIPFGIVFGAVKSDKSSAVKSD